ncbi:MAG: Abi family protein, partial [Flavobacterium sp.]|nr:Abi family protein [Flavobacterium sp.]
ANQGLQITHSSNAEKIIFNNNYFRFKAYFVPFLDPAKKFHSGTHFSEIYGLYVADQNIRDFLFPLVAKLEIAIRANIDNVITCHTNNPFWYLNPDYFTDFDKIKEVLNKSGHRFTTGRQEFVEHYKTRYFTKKSFPYKLLPPFWIISEIFTIEQLLTVAKFVDKDKFMNHRQNKLNECAVNFGFDNYDSLITNLSCILELRNICAHHSRLWNRNLRNPSAISKKITVKINTRNRLYSHLVMLRVMCKKQKINDQIHSFFSSQISSHSIFQRDLNSMGFPNGWDTDPIWI